MSIRKINNYIMIFLLTASFGAYLESIPVTLHQPDGSSIKSFLSGDEYYVRIHDTNNYTIIQSNEDGFYYYASYADGRIVPTVYRADSGDMDYSLLDKGLMISRDAYIHKRINAIGRGSLRDAPTIGTINNINIFIRFADEVEFSVARYVYDEPFNDPDGPSLVHYFDEISYELLEVNTSHYPECDMSTNISYQDQYPRSYYQIYNAFTNPGGYYECPAWEEEPEYDCDSIDTTQWSSYREQTLLKNAIELIAHEVSDTLDVDADGDGYVDNVTFLVNGSPDGWAELLWPHRSSLYMYDVLINEAIVDGYNLNLASGGYFTASVICHEFGHSLGAPDFYRYFDNTITPIGQWDIMAWNASTPQYPSAWTKHRYFNWVECPEIEASGTYSLHPPVNRENTCYRIGSPFSEFEHFIVEYRKNEGMYDTYIPGNNDGILVYRINLDINQNGVIDTEDVHGEDSILEGWTVGGNGFGPPDEMYVYRPSGTLTTNGTINSAIFSASTGRTEINDYTNPSSFLHDGTFGGLSITDIGYPGDTIEFTCNVECLAAVDGDINADEIVNILDVILLVNVILSGDFDSCSDMNSDGVVNIQDIIILVNLIVS